jgi:ATP-dependent Zn protease
MKQLSYKATQRDNETEDWPLDYSDLFAHTPWTAPAEVGTFAALQNALGQGMVGQQAALRKIAAALNCIRHGSPLAGPASLMLMVGPSGSGKTLMAEQRIKAALGGTRPVKTFNMASFANEQDGFGLIGLRDGWSTAHPGKLTSFVRENPYAVVVLDNFDLAHLQVQEILLPMLTTGWLTDEFGFFKDNDTKGFKLADPAVDFRNTIIILTTRLGAEVYENHALMQGMTHMSGQVQRALVDAIASATSGNGRFAVSRSLLDVLEQAHILLFDKLSIQELAQVAENEMKSLKSSFGKTGKPLRIANIQALANALVLSIGNAANAKYVTSAVRSLFIEVAALQASTPNAGSDTTLCIGNADLQKLAFIQTQLGTTPLLELERQNQLLTYALRRARTKSNPALPLVAMTGFTLRKQQSAKDYGNTSGLRSEVPAVRFADIAGLPGVKAKLREVAVLLKAPQRLKLHKLSPPRGMLLWGPPGTAKTTIAKAFAGEAGLPFISVSGPQLLTPSLPHQVFKIARKYAPCVVFIDEIDALGMRGQGGNDIAINQLLTEIDGFETSLNSPVFVIAATNLPGKVDAALLRAGRIEWAVEVPLLDKEGRREFLQRFVPVIADGEFDEQRLLNASAGMSGAEMEQALRQIVMEAIRLNVERIGVTCALEQFSSILHGRRRTGLEVTDASRLNVAYHEAGHAVVSRILNPARAILEVTIAPRRALGFVSLEERRASNNVESLKAEIAMALAGRVAQVVQFGEAGCDTGAESDLDFATRLAYYAVAEWGMDAAFGNISMSALRQAGHTSDALNRDLDQCVKDWLEQCDQLAQSTLRGHWPAVERVVVALMEKETLSREEIEVLVDAA